MILGAASGALRPALANAGIALMAVWLAGLAYLSAQQAQIWRDTESLWRYALEVDPDCSICHGNLGVDLLRRGLAQPASDEFERLKALRPDNKKVYLHIGYMYATQGRFPEAIDNFKVYVAQYPNDVDGLNNLGAALGDQKRGREALDVLQRAMKLKPRNPATHVNMAFAYMSLGDTAKANVLFREALELKYDSPQVWFGLTRLNIEAGNVTAAHTAWGLLGMFDPKLAAIVGPLFTPTW
jgi:Flp pilus assembly protein TadD